MLSSYAAYHAFKQMVVAGGGAVVKAAAASLGGSGSTEDLAEQRKKLQLQACTARCRPAPLHISVSACHQLASVCVTPRMTPLGPTCVRCSNATMRLLSLSPCSNGVKLLLVPRRKLRRLQRPSVHMADQCLQRRPHQVRLEAASC